MRRTDSGLGEDVARIHTQARMFRHEMVVDSIVIGRHENEIITAEGFFGERHRTSPSQGNMVTGLGYRRNVGIVVIYAAALMFEQFD